LEKYNLIGLVVEGKSYIYFYEANNFTKVKAVINVRETQKNIDRLEYKELEIKGIEKYKKIENEKRVKYMIHKKNLELKNKLKNIMKNTKTTDKKINDLIIDTVKNISDSQNKDDKNKKRYFSHDYNKSQNKRKKERIPTPQKLKEEIKNINKEYFERNHFDFYKKLTILSTCFVNDLDTLFVSSSNNKISAWKYDNGEFENINTTEE